MMDGFKDRPLSFEAIESGATQETETKKLQPSQKPFRYKRNGPCPCGSGKKFKACCRFQIAARNQMTLSAHREHYGSPEVWLYDPLKEKD